MMDEQTTGVGNAVKELQKRSHPPSDTESYPAFWQTDIAEFLLGWEACGRPRPIESTSHEGMWMVPWRQNVSCRGLPAKIGYANSRCAVV